MAVGEKSVTDSGNLFFYEASEWLDRRLGTDLHQLPGTHGGFMNQPMMFAEALRPLLRKLL